MSAETKIPAAAARDFKSLSDGELVARTVAGDQAAWREMMRRHDPPLREAIADASLGPALDEADVDDVMGEFWLSLIERDLQRLRMFKPARGAAVLSWLTIQLIQDLRRREHKRSTEPQTVPLDDVDDVGRSRRLLRASTMMRVEEVAERWDLNVKTVYAMIARGELQARRFGRVMRVPRRVVECMEQASVAPERQVKSCR